MSSVSQELNEVVDESEQQRKIIIYPRLSVELLWNTLSNSGKSKVLPWEAVWECEHPLGGCRQALLCFWRGCWSPGLDTESRKGRSGLWLRSWGSWAGTAPQETCRGCPLALASPGTLAQQRRAWWGWHSPGRPCSPPGRVPLAWQVTTGSTELLSSFPPAQGFVRSKNNSGKQSQSPVMEYLSHSGPAPSLPPGLHGPQLLLPHSDIPSTTGTTSGTGIISITLLLKEQPSPSLIPRDSLPLLQRVGF